MEGNHMYDKILILLDGSEHAERILPHAEEIAQQFGSKLLLLQVVDPFSVVDWADEAAPRSLDEKTKRMSADAESYLTDLQGQLEKAGIEAEAYVEKGYVVRRILDVARREDVNLIAMTSHGRTGLASVFYGSVAAGVLQQTDRPLLLVRALGDE
jgi:nucleotide-binding universal stress UspA family protein